MVASKLRKCGLSTRLYGRMSFTRNRAISVVIAWALADCRGYFVFFSSAARTPCSVCCFCRVCCHLSDGHASIVGSVVAWTVVRDDKSCGWTRRMWVIILIVQPDVFTTVLHVKHTAVFSTIVPSALRFRSPKWRHTSDFPLVFPTVVYSSIFWSFRTSRNISWQEKIAVTYAYTKSVQFAEEPTNSQKQCFGSSFGFASVMVYRVAATRIDISYRGMSVPIFYYISILSPTPSSQCERVFVLCTRHVIPIMFTV